MWANFFFSGRPDGWWVPRKFLLKLVMGIIGSVWRKDGGKDMHDPLEIGAEKMSIYSWWSYTELAVRLGD